MLEFKIPIAGDVGFRVHRVDGAGGSRTSIRQSRYVGDEGAGEEVIKKDGQEA